MGHQSPQPPHTDNSLKTAIPEGFFSKEAYLKKNFLEKKNPNIFNISKQ